MNNLPRQKLCEIIIQHGQSVYDDPQRFEAILRDFCGQYRKEISVLIWALKDDVPNQLQSSKNSIPHPVLLARFSKRLQENLGFTEEASTWAVESWALALGVISEAEIHQINPAIALPPTQVTMSVAPSHQPPLVQPPTQPPATRGNKKAIVIGVVGILVLIVTIVHCQKQPQPEITIEKQEQEIRKQRQQQAIDIIYRLYSLLSDKNFAQAMELYIPRLEGTFSSSFFGQFERVTVENLQVIYSTDNWIKVRGENTYFWTDGSSQKEIRDYTVSNVNGGLKITDSAFVQVTKNRY